MIDEQTIADLKAKHPGPLELLTIKGEDFVIKGASPEEWDQFQDLIHDEKKRARALASLARNCVVHPPRPEFNAVLARKPALAMKIADSVVELSGMSSEVEKKTL